MKTPLPIDEVIPELQAALAANSAVVLKAPPGAGKSTRVPLELLDAAWLRGKTILMLEPRRLAARGVAAQMANTLGEKPGERVGFRVRFDNCVGKQTRIEVVTEGILTRRLQRDPELVGVGLVIFDEFHERNLHSDLALALCVDAQQGLREDLKLLVMSATLDGAALSTLLDAPVVSSEGRSYPVEISYQPGDERQRIDATLVQAVVRAFREREGDILAFLPGAGEIRRAHELLQQQLVNEPVDIYPLYGDLPLDQQKLAIRPAPNGRRKVVLSTPIAETSLTIEGVTVVVDSGWQRVPRFDPRSGLTRLETIRVSNASAEQRAGRAGRLAPGCCYRLWSSTTQSGLVPFNSPEIVEADLLPLALDLARWGVSDAETLVWLSPPPAAALTQARALLQRLEALDERGRITKLGERMATLPMHPRLAHMVIKSEALGEAALACDIAALISERDLLRGAEGLATCDFALRLEALRAHRADGAAAARGMGADGRAAVAIERASRQWRHLFKVQADNGSVDEAMVGLLLANAYPDRVAQRRGANGNRYLLANGRGAKLLDSCRGAELMVAVSLDGRGDESRIFLAASIAVADLEQSFPAQIAWQAETYWSRSEGVVVSREARRYGALLLGERPLKVDDEAAVVAAMLDGVRAEGLEALPWSDAARQLRTRLRSLRQWLPDEAWPDLSDSHLLETVEVWLAPYLNNISRRSHLARLDMVAIIKSMLDWSQQQQLEELAPTHLQVPSGSRKRLEYQVDGSAPVLAVKLQELFGLAETPAVARGRVEVMLHLLSPAQRPIQVTQDLKSFWANTYAEVKRELKGRYPKLTRNWPVDPLTLNSISLTREFWDGVNGRRRRSKKK